MRGLVDLHNHLLPGVDDGARTAEESCAHLARWFAGGVTAAILTPHLLVPKLSGRAGIATRLEELRAVFDALVARTSGRADLPALRLGQEVLAPDGATMRRVADDPEVGLGDSNYVLVEFGFSPAFDAEGCIDAAIAAGRLPLIAHPERYAFPPDCDAIATIASWRERGALLQVNGGSLSGRYGDRIGERARQLLLEDLVTVVASDHHGDSRPDDPLDTWVSLAELMGETQADLVYVDRPRRIFDDRALELHGPRRAAS